MLGESAGQNDGVSGGAAIALSPGMKGGCPSPSPNRPSIDRRRAAALVVASLAGSFSCDQERPPAPTERCPAPCAAKGSAQAVVLFPGGRSIADVAEQDTPSVVSVLSEKPLGTDVVTISPEQRPQDVGPNLREYNLGSGVIVSPDGVIVTNSHVVENAERILVALKDGRTLEAKLVGADPPSDLAVLRVEAKNLPAIEFADSSRLRIGDVVLAIGNPFGIGQTVTMGIVSAVGRVNMGITEYDDFIQTDAAINPGNSGGALVNMEGKLVGINTAIISRNGGYQGIGFAIPSRMAIQIKDSLLAHGKMIRGWLGVAFEDLPDESDGLSAPRARTGAVISQVAPESPAAKSGLKRGDVITAINGVKTVDADQARNLIAMTEQGAELNMDVHGDGKDRSLKVRLAEQTGDALH